jgi:agmatine deiminase
MVQRRLPAEWEPQSAVQFTFPHADSDWAESLEEVIPCFVECITQVSRFEKVVVVCADVEQVRALLSDANASNLRLVALSSNDTWARDHGAITIEEDGKPVLLDFMFNGWGLKFAADKDNLITAGLWQKGIFGDTPRRVAGLVFESGGIENDGQGTLLTTAECLLSPNRNPHLSQKEIEAQLADLLGAERVMWLHHGYLAGDDTDSHIDTLARFCSADTIAYVKCTDASDEHYEELAKMEMELQQMPYKLVPLPWPDACFADDGHRLPATYANFLIINGAVLVPTYGVAQDGEALRVLQGCFPDREVIGINCRALIEQHGSLHCISMQFPEGVVD